MMFFHKEASLPANSAARPRLVNSNAGIFLAKQILDAIPSFGKFDSHQPSLKSLACQTYSNSGIAKAEVALMTLGKTSFCDIAAHQRDDLFA